MTIDETRWRAVFEDVCAPHRFVAVRPLAGGISAETVEIDYLSPDGQLGQIIGRRHGAADLARNPRIAHDELRLLRHLRDVEVRAPGGIGVSDSGIFPNPVLLIEKIEGEDAPRVPNHPELAADLLASIHQRAFIDELRFLPTVSADLPEVPVHLDETLQESRIRAILADPDPPATRKTVLLHGDFWPGNILWIEGRLPAAIDWEDAALGDPLRDLANARLEWRFAYHAGMSERFTRRYKEATERDLSVLPWWDLRAALRFCGRLDTFGLDADTERRWRAKHRRFVDEAIARLQR